MTDKLNSKEKTILAAAKLLRRRGYHDTALSDILEAAGSPRGSLYFHFPKGKEEIAVAALVAMPWTLTVISSLGRTTARN